MLVLKNAELFVLSLHNRKRGHPNLEFAGTEKGEKLWHEETVSSTGWRPSAQRHSDKKELRWKTTAMKDDTEQRPSQPVRKLSRGFKERRQATAKTRMKNV